MKRRVTTELNSSRNPRNAGSNNILLENVSTSQSTVVSDSDECEVIAVITAASKSDVFYYRLYDDGPVPFLKFLKEVFPTCSNCELKSESICGHIEEQIFMGYLQLKKLFSSARYGRFKEDQISSGLGTASVPEFIEECFTPVAIEGDGNCCFSAISVSLSLDPVFGKAIRRCGLIALLFDEELQPKLNKLTATDLESQRRIFATNGRYASRHSMFIISEVVSRPVIVYSYNILESRIVGTTYDSRTCSKNPPLYLWFKDRHFSSLILKSGKKAPNANYEIPEFRVHSATSADNDIPAKCPNKSVAEDDSSDIPEPGHLKLNPETATDVILRCLQTECPRDLPKNYFSTLDDECFQNVLKYFKVDMEVLSGASHHTKLAHLERLVNSTESWDLFSKRVLAPRKLNKTKMYSIQRRIYLKQRGLQGRNHFVNMMKRAGYDETLQESYLELCAKKFGSVSKPDLGSAASVHLTQEIQATKDISQQQESKVNTLIDNNADSIPLPVKSSTVGKVMTESEGSITGNDDHEQQNRDGDGDKDDNDTNINTSPSKIPENKVEAVCAILKMAKEDLSFQPPRKFNFIVGARQFKLCFNFKKMMFRDNIWPIIIRNAMTKVQKVCSFNAERPPYYYKERKDFCRLNGECGGDCEMKFTVIIKRTPQMGKPVKCFVTSEGEVQIVQSKPTGRQLRSVTRVMMKKELKSTKALTAYYRNIRQTPGLQALHKNEIQKNKDVLRKARSEIKNEERLDMDPIQDLLLLKKKYIEKDEANQAIRGYVQDINPTSGSLKVILFSPESLMFHESQAKSGLNTCFLDATGGICRKTSEKMPLMYFLIGRNQHNVSYPIAEFILEDGSNVEIMHCLTRIRFAIQKLKPLSNRCFTDIIVIDWSWSMIHAVCKGINHMEVLDYIQTSWKLLDGKSNAKWDARHSCIFICTSHMIAAARRLFAKALCNSKLDRHIMNAALNAVARAQECFNLTELKEVLVVICRTFGLEFIPKSELDQNLAFLEQKKLPLDILMKSETDPEEIELPKNNDGSSSDALYKKSPFYRIFESTKTEQLMSGKWRAKACTKNPYHNLKILEYFGRYKIPFFPLWAAAIPRAAKDPTFIRETNATVESSFNKRKTNFMSRRNQIIPTVVRECNDFHHATLRDAALQDVANEQNVNPKKGERDINSELKSEKWKKSGSGRRKSKHFSDRKILSSLAGKNCKALVHPPKFGLPNIGLSCYMSSTFQMIMCMPAVVDRVFIGELKDPFLSIFNALFMKAVGAQQVNSFKKDLDKLTAHNFPARIQHDPHEFLKKLLMADELKFMWDLLPLFIERTLQCHGCSYVSNRTEKLTEIITLPNMHIPEGIKRLFGTATLVPDYKCEECGSSATKVDELVATSEYILVVTEQYDDDSDITNPQKVVMLPKFNVPSRSLELTLRAEKKLYHLISFIAHEGSSLHSGHYRAYVVDDEKFRCCDDDRVYLTDTHCGTVYLQLYRLSE